MRTLEITTQISCRNNCLYCPRDKLEKAYKDDIRSIILSDFMILLSRVPKDVRIDFSGFSEIFLNSSGSLMIAYAIRRGYNVALYTTLVGFTEKDAKILKDLFIGDIFLHQHDGKNFNQEYFDKQSELIRKYVKGNYRSSKLEKQWQWSRAGNLWEMNAELGMFSCCLCGSTFDHNVLLPNGDVYLCCMDYGLKHKIGNLYQTDYDHLDRQSIIDLSNQEDSEVICRKCEHFLKR